MHLKVAFMSNPRLQPFVDGTIQLDGIELDWMFGHPASLHLRHLLENAFDIFEFSLSGYIVVRDRPNMARLGWTAIPVFLSKAFLPLELCVNKHAGIHSWANLAGKRIGLPDYNMTAAIWMRIMLMQLYGIQPSDITWFNGRKAVERHSTVIGFHTSPPGVTVHEPGDDAALNDLLEHGDIDAAFGDWAAVPINEGPNVRRLLNTEQGAQLITDFMQKTGTTPINHCVVMHERLLIEQPQLALALYKALEAAKQESYRRARREAEAYLLFPDADFAHQAATFGSDPYPFGLAANRRMLELLVGQLASEEQVERRESAEYLFAETTYNT